MKSFNNLYSEFGVMTKDTATANTTFGKAQINQTQKIVLGGFQWPFLERTRGLTSTANGDTYELPPDCRKVMSVKVTVSASVDYDPKPIDDPIAWEKLQSMNVSASDVTQFYYVLDKQIILWPAISTAGLTITVRYRKLIKDMTADDYTTGSVQAWTNGDDDITGVSTVWTEAMVGRYIRVTSDGLWYEIESRSSNTAIVTVKNFLGTSISSATEAYTIGEMPVIPEAYQDLLLYRPVALYLMANAERDMVRADRYWMMYDGGYERGLSPRVGGTLKRMQDEYFSKTEGMYFESSEDLGSKIIDHNWPPTNVIGQNW